MLSKFTLKDSTFNIQSEKKEVYVEANNHYFKDNKSFTYSGDRFTSGIRHNRSEIESNAVNTVRDGWKL